MSMEKVVANAIVLELLDKDNYIDWSEQVKIYLLAQDLWDIVEGITKPDPPTIENDKDESNAWKKKNASALHAIQMSCSRDTYHVIRGIDSARSAWDALSAKFKLQLCQEENKEKGKNSNATGAESSTASTYDYEPFFNAAKSGDLNAMNDFISQDRAAVSAREQGTRKTALHIAADYGKVQIVENLVSLMSEKDLEVQLNNGVTALIIAANVGNTPMAKCMIEKNKRLLGIADMFGNIPILSAFNFNHEQLGRYLYSVTPEEVLLSREGIYAAAIIVQCIYNRNNFDIALDLLHKIPPSAIVKDWEDGRQSPLLALASKPSAFYSGCRLMFWQRWIYHSVQIKLSSWTSDICISVRNLEGIQSTKRNIFGSGLNLLQQLAKNSTQLLGIKHIYEMKSVHIHCNELLKLMCELIKSDYKQFHAALMSNAVFQAIDLGIVEFVNGIFKEKPSLVWDFDDDKGKNIFMHATQFRHEKIFSLIHGMQLKYAFLIKHDYFENNMLHIAGMLAPYRQLNRISGAALQMQRELQWFKEIEALVPTKCLEAVNKANKMTPRDLFTENHKDLVKEGEKWMKETATSCTVIGALIVTIMFTAAFTVPGGNEGDTGYPIFLQKKSFMVFIISDVISLFSSTTSVLMFLGVLTTRYAEEDFLKSLPTKLILGLSTLFLSIATMMVSFSAALFIILQTQSWILIPVVLLSSIPITLFAWMQFPLLVEIFMSTYGPSIFEHKVDRWY